MALPYLNQKIESSAVASIDSYFSIPDFQISEKIFHILLSMKLISQKIFLIQTRQTGVKIFDYVISGNLMDFYRDEIENRKLAGYPPFTTCIKISLSGEKAKIKGKMKELSDFLLPYKTEVYDAWSHDKKSIVHALITLPKEEWIDEGLLNKLKSLTPQYAVKIDPGTLL
jgi:primosomal protein N'